MTQNKPEQCQADFRSCRNSGGALFHAPPPLAARGFTRRRRWRLQKPVDREPLPLLYLPAPAVRVTVTCKSPKIRKAVGFSFFLSGSQICLFPFRICFVLGFAFFSASLFSVGCRPGHVGRRLWRRSRRRQALLHGERPVAAGWRRRATLADEEGTTSVGAAAADGMDGADGSVGVASPLLLVVGRGRKEPLRGCSRLWRSWVCCRLLWGRRKSKGRGSVLLLGKGKEDGERCGGWVEKMKLAEGEGLPPGFCPKENKMWGL